MYTYVDLHRVCILTTVATLIQCSRSCAFLSTFLLPKNDAVNKYACYLHFTEKETEALRLSNIRAQR